MITRLAISGYRSLRDVRLELEPLNVVTGPNGSGKSSLYRALRLLADIAQGRVVQSLAAEGGLQSTLWAGPESFSREMKDGTQPVQGTVRKGPVSFSSCSPASSPGPRRARRSSSSPTPRRWSPRSTLRPIARQSCWRNSSARHWSAMRIPPHGPGPRARALKRP